MAIYRDESLHSCALASGGVRVWPAADVYDTQYRMTTKWWTFVHNYNHQHLQEPLYNHRRVSGGIEDIRSLLICHSSSVSRTTLQSVCSKEVPG